MKKKETLNIKTKDFNETPTDMEIRIKEALKNKKLSEQARTKKPNTKQKEAQEKIDKEKEERLKLPFKLRFASKKQIKEHQEKTNKIQERVDRNKKEEDLFFKKRTGEFYNEYKEGSILINKKDNSEYKILKTPTKNGDKNFEIEKLKKENKNGVSLGKITISKKNFADMVRNEEISKKEIPKKTISNPENKLMEKMLPVMILNSPQFMRENGLTKEDLDSPWFKKYLEYLNSGHPKILEAKTKDGTKVFNETYFTKEWPKSVHSFEECLDKRDFINFFREGVFNNYEKTIPIEIINKNPKLKNAYEQGKQKASQTIAGLKTADKFTQENIKNEREFGKFIYHNYTKFKNRDGKERVNKIPHHLMVLGLNALDYDTFIEFNKQNKTFFIYSNKEEIVRGALLDLEKKYDDLDLDSYPNSISYKMKGGEELDQDNFLESLHLKNTSEFAKEKEEAKEELEKELAEQEKTLQEATETAKKLLAKKEQIENNKKDSKNEAEVTKLEEEEKNTDLSIIKNPSVEEILDTLRKKIELSIENTIQKNYSEFENKLEAYKERTDKLLGVEKKEIENTKIFEELNNTQKAIVLQETNKIILDKIEAEAIKQQRENGKKGNFLKKGFKSFFTSYYLAKTKKEIGDKLLHGEEFEKIKAEVSKKIKESNITGEVLENGKISINLLNENVLSNPTEEEKALFKEFNHSANIIIEKSFKDERKEKNDEIWSLKRKYFDNKREITNAIYYNQIKNGLTEIEAMNYAQNIIAKIDTQVIVNRFFTQHPEAEKELEEISKEPGFFKHLGSTFVNKQKGINFAIGASIRAGTASTFGAFTAPIAGLVIGGLMGYKKSAKEMKDDDFLAKSGDVQGKKTDKNFREIIDENNPKAGLAQKLNNLTERIEKETDSNKKAELVRMLKNRIIFTMEKLSKEEVAFGTGIKRVELENELANSLVKAETIKLITERELNITEEKYNEINDDFYTISDKIYSFLERRDRIVKKNRDNKLAWDTAKGALMGAVFAEIGYQAVDYLKTNGYMPSFGLKNLIPSTKINSIFESSKIEQANTDNIESVIKTPNQETTEGLKNEINKVDTAKQNNNINIPKKNIEDLKYENTNEAINAPSKEIKVSVSSLGAIQTINDLKNQLLSEYKGGLTKAPANIQEILTKNSLDLSKELGLFNPEDVNESAMMQKGSTMSINEKGELVLNDIKTGKSFTLIDEKGTVHKYEGEMFDSDSNKTTPKIVKEEEIPLKENNSTEVNNKTIQEEIPLKESESSIKTKTEEEKFPEIKTDNKVKRFIFEDLSTKYQTPPKARFYFDDNGNIEKYETEQTITYQDKEAYINRENLDVLKTDPVKYRQAEMALDKAISDSKTIEMMDKSLKERSFLVEELKKQQENIIEKYGNIIQKEKLISEEIENKQDNINTEKSNTNTEDPYTTKIVNKKELLDNTFEKNLKNIIKNEKTNITWQTIKNDSKDLTAHKIMSMDKENVPERLKPFYNYLTKIKEISRLKPIREDEFTIKNETVEEYIKRGLEKIIRKGKIEKLTF